MVRFSRISEGHLPEITLLVHLQHLTAISILYICIYIYYGKIVCIYIYNSYIYIYTYLFVYLLLIYLFIEGSLEVKLPTIWRDGKAEVGRVREEKSRSEKIREKKE